MPAAPAKPTVATREPGVHLDAETISWLGRPLEPLSSYPIDANDIRRWAQTAYYPALAPRELTELADGATGPWHALVALRDFNPYYERDHMYAAAMLAPWTIAGQRFVATADLKRLRYPADGPFGPIEQGSYLTMYWIVAGKLDEQQAWVSDQMKLLATAGRTF